MKLTTVIFITTLVSLSSCSFETKPPVQEKTSPSILAPWEVKMNSGTTIVTGGWVVPIK